MLLSIGAQLFQKYGEGLFRDAESGTTRVKVGVAAGDSQVIGRVINELHTLPFLKAKRDVDVQVGSASVAAGDRRVNGKVVEDTLRLDIATSLNMLLLNPLRRLQSIAPGEKVLIVIDALDQSLPMSGRGIAGIIPSRGDPLFPSNLRFLLTSRPGDHLAAFDRDELFDLDEGRQSS